MVGELSSMEVLERIAYAAGIAAGARKQRSEIIEECCAGAVVKTLRVHVRCCDGHAFARDKDGLPCNQAIPIAAAPASLAEEVALELLDHAKFASEPIDKLGCIGRRDAPPPFAAAYADGPDGRAYVLVSGACEACEGVACKKTGDSPRTWVASDCPDCNGTGARTDVGEIARRYGGDGSARVARFEVKR